MPEGDIRSFRAVARWTTTVATVSAFVALTACLACSQDDGSDVVDCVDLDITLSDVIPTVAQVAFSSRSDSAILEVLLDGGVARTIEADGTGGSYDERIWGLKADTVYEVRVTASDCSATASLETGPIPSVLPDLTISDPEAMAETGGYYLTSLVRTPSTVVLIDEDGDPVWWYTEEQDVESLVSRAILSVDGESIVYLNFPTRAEDDGLHDLVRVSIDGTTVERIPMQSPHHDFTELPDGTIAVIEFDTKVFDGEEIVGDKIVEIAPDGTARTAWSLWDEMEYDELIGQSYSGTGWSHANAIDYDASLDGYDVSMSNFRSIYRISRDTGLIWERVGGESSDYTNPDTADGEVFERIHQFDFDDDGVLVFDNGEAGNVRSRAVEFELDAGSGTATPTWSFEHDPALYVTSLGDAFKLDSGERIVIWSTAGRIDAISEAGEVLWSVQSDLGAGIGYVTRLENL